MRDAISSLRAQVLAMPACWSSSMVSATHAAPYFFSSGQILFRRSSPSSRLIELTIALPPWRLRPSSITTGSVESNMIGAFTWRT